MSVRVVVGLGNPGPLYDRTRHNIGFTLVDALASREGVRWKDQARFCAHTASVVIAGQPVLLAKPQTFMNASGRAVGSLCRYHRWSPGEVCVVYDEYQLPVGQWKLSIGGGAGGHNGISDIVAKVAPDFVRFRIGIGPSEKPAMRLTDFVLGRFTDAEQGLLDIAWPRLLEGLDLLLREGPQRAMNSLNRRSKTKSIKDESDGNETLPGHRDSEHPGLSGPGGIAGGQTEDAPQEPGRGDLQGGEPRP
jgi:peptidyl-tRNA hydrolase, PTH1 family